MIAEVDANKNGTIDLDEFYQFMAAKMANEDKEENIRQESLFCSTHNLANSAVTLDSQWFGDPIQVFIVYYYIWRIDLATCENVDILAD